MTSGVTCHLSLVQHSWWDDFSVVWHYRTWTAYTLGECLVRLSIMAIGKNTRSNDVRRGSPLSPLNNIDRVEKRVAWHTIIALGQHTQSNDVGLGMLSLPLDCTHGRTTLGMVMLSSPLDFTYSRMSSGVKCHHCPLNSTHSRMTLTWNAIIAFGFHTQMDDVGCGINHRPCEAYTVG